MASRAELNRPMTRKRRKENEQLALNKKLMEKWLQPVVVIGPKDIVVNRNLGKIKIEENGTDIKPKVKVEESFLYAEGEEEEIDVENGVWVLKGEVCENVEHFEQEHVNVEEGSLAIEDEENEIHIKANSTDTDNLANFEKIKEESGLLKQPEVQVEQSFVNISAENENIDVENGVLVFKDELEVSQNTEQFQNATENLCEDSFMGDEENEHEVDHSVKQADTESVANFEQIRKENQLLEQPVENQKSDIVLLDKVLNDRDMTFEALRNEVHSLKRINLEQQVKIRILEQTKKCTSTGKDILEIFPKKVWTIVLSHLQNPDDKISVSNSSLHFRDELHSHRTLFLFPAVWNILGKVYESSSDISYTKRKIIVTQHLTDWNWFSDILKLRLVCHSWKQAFDNFYRNFPAIYEMHHDATKSKIVHKVDMGIAYDQTAEWTWTSLPDRMFLNHFCATHAGNKSPFIANAVKIYIGRDCSNEKLQNLKPCLQEYGKFVWHCRLAITIGVEELKGVYTDIYSILSLMPNLVSLRLWYSHDIMTGTTGSCSFRHIHSYSKSELLPLKKDIDLHPMPTCKNLKFLKLSHLPGPLLHEILSKNAQVSILDIQVQGFDTPDSINLVAQPFANLTQFSCQCFKTSDLETLYATNWQLNKIYLDFDKGDYIEWSKIFSLLENKWANTATNVMLGLPIPETDIEHKRHKWDKESLKLNLPNVKRLKLVLELSSIDFLLPMKENLECLEIIMRGANQREKTRKWYCESKMRTVIEWFRVQDYYSSNIWVLFPKLQRLELNGIQNYYSVPPDNYTRTGWALRNKKRLRFCLNWR